MAPFGKVPKEQQLTATQRDRVRSELVTFRAALWQKAILTNAKMRHRPPSSYLPDNSILTITDNFKHLTTHTVERLAIILPDNKLLEPHRLSLAQKITGLRKEFSGMAEPESEDSSSSSSKESDGDDDREHGEDDNEAITAAAYKLAVPPVLTASTQRYVFCTGLPSMLLPL